MATEIVHEIPSQSSLLEGPPPSVLTELKTPFASSIKTDDVIATAFLSPTEEQIQESLESTLPGRLAGTTIETPYGQQTVRDLQDLGDRIAVSLELYFGNTGVWHRATPGIIGNAFDERARQNINRAKKIDPKEVRNNVLAIPASKVHLYVDTTKHDPRIQEHLRNSDNLVAEEGGLFINVHAQEWLKEFPHLVKHHDNGDATAVIYVYNDPGLEDIHERVNQMKRADYKRDYGMDFPEDRELFAIQGTSANVHGIPQPRSFESMDEHVKHYASFYLDAANTDQTQAFPIVDLTGRSVNRPGEEYGIMREGPFQLPEALATTLEELRDEAAEEYYAA